jgi:outer membrane autotransporter protein
VNVVTLQDSFSQFAHTPNQHAVAHDLDSFSGWLSPADPRGSALISLLDTYRGTQLPAAFDLIAPTEFSALPDFLFGSADTIEESVQSRMNGLRTGYGLQNGNTSLLSSGSPLMQLAFADEVLPPMGDPKQEDTWNAYAGGFGQFLQVNGDADAPGYSVVNSGATVDFDKLWDTGLVGGFTLDYLNGQAGLANGGNATMQGGRAGLYGSWFGDHAYLEGQLGGGGSFYNTTRATLGGFANGSSDGYEMDGMLGGGYDLKFKHLVAGVLAEGHYTFAELDGFTESGSASPLQIMDQSYDSCWTLLAGHLAYEWRIYKQAFLADARVGWRHEYLDTSRQVSAQFASGAGSVFQVDGPSLGTDSLFLQAGLSTRCTEHLSIFVNYDGEVGRDHSSSQAVNGGLSWSF